MNKEVVVETAYVITEAIATGGFSLITEPPRLVYHLRLKTVPQTGVERIVEAIRTGGFSLIMERKEPRG